ncbi:MAG: cobalamin-independent methionine synthase II family protein [Chloroflexi bacterium]|nr:cobalamin-independent methionine synthase II family protein [Chloroflexota bacterium]
MVHTDLPLFPVTVVGSWPRPDYLVTAFRRRRAGSLSAADFDTVADRAVLEALRYQEEAGVDIVSDGEQRRVNFYAFVAEKLAGVQLMSLAELMDLVEDRAAFDQILRSMDAPAFAIHNATVVDRVSRRQPLALDEYRFLHANTDRPIKIALPGPYLLTRSMWVKGVSNRAYPTMDDLAVDIVQILREELIDLRDAGVDFVQFDEPVLTNVVFRPEVKERTFMCASMAASSGNPGQELLWAVRLMNAVLKDVKGVRTGIHICRGNWSRQEGALLQGSYQPLIDYLHAMQLDQFVLEYATPRAGDLAVFARYPRQREIGLGVVNPRTDTIEPPEFVAERVHEALRYFDPRQIYLNPDCGFGTFADRPMNPPEIASRKLATIARAAQALRQEHA